MSISQIHDILHKIQHVKIAVYGDFCLDAYWYMNPAGGEISAETGLHSKAVEKHYYSLGGASNVVGNLAALNPASIEVIGVIGDDIYGRELQRQLKELNVNINSLIIQEDNFDTVTFAKRILTGEEQSRIDFGFLRNGGCADMRCHVAIAIFPLHSRFGTGCAKPAGCELSAAIATLTLLDDLMANPVIISAPIS